MENLHGKQVFILIALLFLLMLSTGNFWGVIETSEARYAEISREMYRSNDWLHPTLLNIYHYHKPPVTYWLTAAAYTVFGVNAFAARFFLLIAFLVQVLLINKVAYLLFKDKLAGYYSTLVYATLPIVLVSVRGLTTDAYLITFMLLSLYLWLKFLDSRKTRFLYLMAFSMGLGFMTKGPVIFFVLLFMLGLRKLYVTPKVSIKEIGMAVLIFTIIAFTWFIFIIMEDSRLAEYFVFRHVVDRIVHAEVFSRKEPWFYYLPLLPLITLPWIVLFIAGFFRKEMNVERYRVASQLLIWWFLVPLIIFSISSSKLVLYILPLSIAFSLITGSFLAGEIPKQLLLVVTGLAVLLYAGQVSIPFHSPQFEMNGPLLVIPLTAMVISAGVWFLKINKTRMTLLLSGTFAINLILFTAFFFRMNGTHVNTLTAISKFIRQNELHERKIIVYDELLPSLAFELDKDIVSVHAGNRLLKRETQFERDDHWKNNLIDITAPGGLVVLESLLSDKSVLIVKKQLPESLQIPTSDNWHHTAIGKWIVYYN